MDYVTQKEIVIALINDYYDREGFNIKITESDIDRGIVDLAYTSYEFVNKDTGEVEEHELQVSFDMNLNTYINEIDGRLVLTQTTTPDAFMLDIECGDFNGFLRDVLDLAIERYGELV